jgi:HTH-type transcriptional regulator / antitoxin MqsA
MICGSCGADELVADVRDIPYSYMGMTTIIKQVRGKYCGACGEGQIAAGPGGEVDRLSKGVAAFINKVREEKGLPKLKDSARQLYD